jgi:hypothetical protein
MLWSNWPSLCAQHFRLKEPAARLSRCSALHFYANDSKVFYFSSYLDYYVAATLFVCASLLLLMCWHIVLCSVLLFRARKQCFTKTNTSPHRNKNKRCTKWHKKPRTWTDSSDKRLTLTKINVSFDMSTVRRIWSTFDHGSCQRNI